MSQSTTQHPASPTDTKKPGQVRLLSIDGGGTRGLASILTLKHIMNQINEDRPEGLKPYEVFDLIGGTGTGGYVLPRCALVIHSL